MSFAMNIITKSLEIIVREKQRMLMPNLPSNPKQGDKFFDKNDDVTWIYLNRSWINYDVFIKRYNAFNDMNGKMINDEKI